MHLNEKEQDDLMMVSGFPRRLYTIVSNPENHHIINWKDKGDQFIIYNPNEFAEKILSTKDFNSANYSSFIRQLNMYDFHKVKSKTRERSDTFYNRFFIKDKPYLLKNIKRKNNNTTLLINNNNIYKGNNIKTTHGVNKKNKENFEDLKSFDETETSKQQDNKEINCISTIYPLTSELRELNTAIKKEEEKDKASVSSGNNSIQSYRYHHDKKKANSLLPLFKESNISKININSDNNINTSSGKNRKFSREKNKKANKIHINHLYTTFVKNVRIFDLSVRTRKKETRGNRS